MAHLLETTIEGISPLSVQDMNLAQNRWNSIAKPLHSLGILEDLIIQIAGITGSADLAFQKKAIVEFCADNGVVAEGVTQTGQEVTAIVAENFLDGATTSYIMGKISGADILPFDMGMVSDTRVDTRFKVRYGTANMVKESAMSREEAIRAIEAGIRIAEECKEKGYGLLATGEMGIGNTTTSSAVASLLLNQDVEMMTGRGAGLSSEGLERKVRAIREAIRVNEPNPQDPLDVLAKVGGLDIAGMTGLYLGAAKEHIPVVMDGFISCVAALVAVRLCKAVEAYLLPSHVSQEPASILVLKALGKDPILHAKMCLGEGTGAAALFPLLDMAAAVYGQMSTFGEIKVDAYEELS